MDWGERSVVYAIDPLEQPTLTRSGYPDGASLEGYWGRLRDKVDDTKPVSTAVAQSAAWLQTAR